MKLWRILLPLTLCLVLAVLFLPTTANATEYKEGYYNYTVTDGEATITGRNEFISGNITIPSTLGGYPVTTIAYKAFYYCTSLTGVTIPDSVTTIGEYAFYNCDSLTGVTIPDSVTTIGDYAFRYCSGLTSVTIGNSVTTIGNYAFSNCDNLTTVTIPENVASIGTCTFIKCDNLLGFSVDVNNTNYSNDNYGVLYNKAKTELIQAPPTIVDGYVLANNVTSISDYAFYNCDFLSNVTIPASLATIGVCAFQSCENLRFVYYYGTKEQWESISIGSYNSDLECATCYTDGLINSGICGDNLRWRLDFSYVLTITGTGPMSNYSMAPWHYDCVKKAVIEEGVTTIGDYAFEYCESLTSVAIPDSVTSIGEAAFHYCINLTNITMGSGVITIGNHAFFECAKLTSIIVPDSVATIGEGAFSRCSALETVRMGRNVALIGDDAFYYCANLTRVTIPEGVTVIGQQVFSQCASLTDVIISNNVKAVGYSAFSYCTSLTNVSIGNNVKTIGNYAFSNCSKLPSITIPESVTTIGNTAFRDCNSLTDVYYTGTRTQWEAISVGEYNAPLLNANLHCEKNVVGDVDGNEELSTDDAVYLLLHVMFGAEDYPTPDGMTLDLNADGKMDTNDAVYLLLHVMFGEEDYPLTA